MSTIVILSLLIVTVLPLFQLSILCLLINHFPTASSLHFSVPSDQFFWDAGLSSEPVCNFKLSLTFLHYPILEASELSSDYASFEVSFPLFSFHCHYIFILDLRFQNSILTFLPASTIYSPPSKPACR